MLFRDPGYVSKTFRNPAVDGSSARRVTAPSCAAIGWIPYYGCAEAMGRSPLRPRYEADQAIRMLFASGNPEPQQEFSGDVRFLDRLGLGDFRSALALRRPRLLLNREGRVLAVQIDTLRRVGRTPAPWFRDALQIQLKGREEAVPCSRNLPMVRFSDFRAEIAFELSFKLGRLADLTGAMMTGKLAPFAWMELRYRLSSFGDASVSLNGSGVPSFAWYIESSSQPKGSSVWKKQAAVDMELADPNTFSTFADTDSMKRGPKVVSLHTTLSCHTEEIQDGNRTPTGAV